MPDLAARAPLQLPGGRQGWLNGAAGITLLVIGPRFLATVMARRGQREALAVAVKKAFGLELPRTPRLARGSPVSFLWSGHDQWFAMADGEGYRLPDLQKEVGAFASLSDQSDSRFSVELSGSCAGAVLGKLTSIDFHPRAFHLHDTAATQFGHISGQVTQTGDGPIYELMVFRGFAESFAHDVLTAAQEFGVEVR